jgi:hypothetical protein
MPTSQNEDLDGTPFEGDRPGPHPVDVLGQLPIDGEPIHETQLMSDAELDPRAVQGDRFEVGDDDLGVAPDLELEPDAPDLRPDTVKRFAEAEENGEPDPDEADEFITARPTVRALDDELLEPAEPGEE